jgi:hypothetical protein
MSPWESLPARSVLFVPCKAPWLLESFLEPVRGLTPRGALFILHAQFWSVLTLK